MPYTGIARCIIKGRLAGLVATRNMFTGQIQLTGTDTDYDVFVGYINRMWVHIAPYISTIWVRDSMEIQHWIDTEWISMSDEPFEGAGTGSGDVSPNLVAAVLVGKAVGKRLMGRKFFSGLIESATDANSLTVTALAAFASAAVDYVDLYETPAGSQFGPGILAADHTFHSFSSGLVSALLGTMRRRKPGLGI